MMMIDAKKSEKKLTRPHEVWVQNRYTPIPLYLVGQNKFMTKPDTVTWQRAWIKQGWRIRVIFMIFPNLFPRALRPQGYSACSMVTNLKNESLKTCSRLLVGIYKAHGRILNKNKKGKGWRRKVVNYPVLYKGCATNTHVTSSNFICQNQFNTLKICCSLILPPLNRQGSKFTGISSPGNRVSI